MPAGVEFATELTFPSPESTVSGILLATSQILAVTLTAFLSFLQEKSGTFYAILAQIMVLATGTCLTFFTPNKLRRQAAFNKDIEFTKVPTSD